MRRKKTPLQKLNEKAYAMWRQVVIGRAKGKCEWCGAPGADCHHMVTKGSSRFLRHDPRNGVLLCKRCHFHFHDGNARTGIRMFEEMRPEDAEYVYANEKTLCKPNKDFVEMEIQLLKEYLDE